MFAAGADGRYRCLACGGTFSNRIDSAYFRLRCSAVTFDRVARFSVEGMSRSAIACVEGVSWHTADRWVSKASDYACRFNDQMLHDVELVELQADELKTLLTTKAQAIWVFTSMELKHSGLQVQRLILRLKAALSTKVDLKLLAQTNTS